MNFADMSLWANAAIFLAAAIAVWLAGTKLARYADEIASRTGMGREVLGILLLGGVTSLPELAVSTTATLQGAAQLGLNDVLGSAAINLVVLAVADAISGRRALTAVQGSPLLMLQGVIGMLLLALVIAPYIAGDMLVFGMGVWSWIMLVTYVVGVRVISSSHAGRAWHASSQSKPKRTESSDSAGDGDSFRALLTKTVGVAAVILFAGFLLAQTGNALAEQTGLGTSFFGAVFLALATSLPEWSTVIAATRIGRYEMAISDIFGTNLFNVTIVVLVDALADGEPVLTQGGAFPAFGAVLALALTSFLVIGMLERRDRTFLRMGWDSVAVLIGYAGGVVVLHGLR